MRYITILLAGLAFLIACDTSCSVKENIQGPGNLETTQYVINTDRDTILQTKNGALLKISKGAITSDDGNPVTLDIKEAYSLEQIIKGGLTTTSNGEPLSSGGMIYINPSKGQHATIKQKIQVAIPANFLQNGMQLFKGEENSDGKINWTSPVPLADNKQIAAIDSGKILFESSCTSCHAIGRPLTGPDLAHFMKRFPPTEENYKYYQPHSVLFRSESVTDPVKNDTSSNEQDSEVYTYNYHPEDLYYCNLRSMFGSIGPLFPSITRNNLLSIYGYIQNESDRLDLPLPGHAYLKDCTDSCKLYTEKTKALISKKQRIERKRERLIEKNGPLVDEKSKGGWIKRPVAPFEINDVDTNNYVTPNYYNAVYYQFSIESFGWYNIDMMMKAIPGVVESELFVRLTGEYKEKVNMYLVIPSVTTYCQGGPAERNEEEFAFYLANGKIRLPQNVPAFILAVSENKNGIAFGVKEFTTSATQQLTMELHASTKKEFNDVMKQFNGANFKIDVDDAKKSVKIRKQDARLDKIDEQLKDLEYLKPQGCDCNCGSHEARDSVVFAK